MMILVADIGNTNIVLGVFEEDVLLGTLRLPSERKTGSAEYTRCLCALLAEQGSAPEQLEGAILSSVVPELTQALAAALQKVTGKPPILVGPQFDHGLAIRNYDPQQLGSDRIVDGVAALAKYPPPLAIFDLGTASTLSVLDADGAFIGGMIMVGLRLGTESLAAHAAQLLPVVLAEPQALLGTDTVSCIQSGAIYAAAAMLDGITERVETELGQPVTMVVTGGLSGLVVPHCRHALHCEENLLLVGLQQLFRRTCCAADPAQKAGASAAEKKG
ncbi:MAG: type III pantothenate kinase [Pygmaiobacter sp.]